MKLNRINASLIVAVFLAVIPNLSFATPKTQPPKNRISMEKAREIAKLKADGQIKSEELEYEDGKWIYSFDMQAPNDKHILEVHVDAISGHFLDSHVETAADEAKEAAEEK